MILVPQLAVLSTGICWGEMAETTEEDSLALASRREYLEPIALDGGSSRERPKFPLSILFAGVTVMKRIHRMLMTMGLMLGVVGGCGEKIRDGRFVDYFESGRIKIEGTYKDGKRDGKWVEYYETDR